MSIKFAICAFILIKIVRNYASEFQSPEVEGRGSETQLQLGNI